MPGRFLSEAERDRLRNFPDSITPDDLITYFTLSQEDLAEVNKRRRDHNRLGFALKVCALRYLGFCPEDLATAPPEAIVYVARQIGVVPGVLSDYGGRRQTTTARHRHTLGFAGQLKTIWRCSPYGFWSGRSSTTVPRFSSSF